jgi:hypothetical protein
MASPGINFIRESEGQRDHMFVPTVPIFDPD